VGYAVVLTARDFAQTRELAHAAGLNAHFVGGEYGTNTIRKSIGLIGRALRLALYLKGKGASLAVGHGSRGLLIASKLLRIPSLTLYDYEGASVGVFNRLSTWVMVPRMLPYETLAKLGLKKEKYLTYNGLKEDVYVADHVAKSLSLKLDESKIIVTVRPPSRTAHYRSEESFALFDHLMQLLVTREDVQVILLARTNTQRSEVTARFGHHTNTIIPTEALPGLDLLHASDLVIGGGGTVNREAAAMGVPVVTIFKGAIGAVDRWLVDSEKMIELERAEEILPHLKKRIHADAIRVSGVREEIVDTILRLADVT
jgi:predicted glycosyltransferase